MTETQVAWLAGLLEGEGSFHLARRGGGPNKDGYVRKPAIRVSLKMKDKDVVEGAADLLGNPSVRYAPDTRESHSDCWELALHGAAAEACMRAVRPYMGLRRGAKIDELLAMKGLSHQ